MREGGGVAEGEAGEDAEVRRLGDAVEGGCGAVGAAGLVGEVGGVQGGEEVREEVGADEDGGEGLDGRGAAEVVGGLDEELDEAGEEAAGFALGVGGEEGGEGGEEAGAGVEHGARGEQDVGLGELEGFAQRVGRGVVQGEEVLDQREEGGGWGGRLREDGGPEVEGVFEQVGAALGGELDGAFDQGQDRGVEAGGLVFHGGHEGGEEAEDGLLHEVFLAGLAPERGEEREDLVRERVYLQGVSENDEGLEGFVRGVPSWTQSR